MVLVACGEVEGPAPSSDPVSDEVGPDLALETQAWPTWAAAMQVPPCRGDAARARQLVDEALADPRRAPAARRTLAELRVCLERHRREPAVTDDAVQRVELDVEAPPTLRAAVEALRDDLDACVPSATLPPRATLRVAALRGDRDRLEGLRVLADDTGDPTLAPCLLRALSGADVTTVPAGEHALTFTLRAGTILVRPCLDERRAPRVRVRVEALRAPPRDGDAPWDEDGTPPDLHALLFFEGQSLTTVPSDDALDADVGRDPRATLRCAVAVSPARPLGVLLLDSDEGRDRVIGFAETTLAEELTRLPVGAGEVVLRRVAP